MDIDDIEEETGSQEDLSHSDETELDKKLQKSLFVNRYLPYHDSLNAEAEEMLMEIKENLSLAVQRHEIWPGATFWARKLQRWDFIGIV